MAWATSTFACESEIGPRTDVRATANSARRSASHPAPDADRCSCRGRRKNSATPAAQADDLARPGLALDEEGVRVGAGALAEGGAQSVTH